MIRDTRAAGRASRRRRVVAAIGAGLLLCVAVLFSMGLGSALLTSCTTTPTAVPVRTFERAQKVDVVCMQVLDPTTGALITPTPQPQSRCAPVPAGVDGTYLPFHLFALVTQLGRGEVAVVDLTQGTVVDIDQATPGFNFHVVGKNPTDIAVTPDGLMTFVAAAEINKPAIYALRNDQILGDWQGAPGSSRPKITNWPACALPQVPGAIAVVPTQILSTTPLADAGSGSGSSDGGAEGGEAGTATDAGTGTATPDSLGYELVAVLPGDARTSAKIVTIDPRPFLRGAALLTDAGPEVAPGSLAKCPITSAIELAGGSYAPAQVQPGPAWDDGIKYVDGGAPAEEVPSTGAGVCAAGNGFTPDAGLPIDAPSDLAARGGTAALSGQIYYVADAVLPLIHVIDLRSGTMKELPPLLATSVTDPSRRVTISQIAVSPATREYKRYLYAIDSKEGTVMVYDVTDPAASSRLPLTRPHPETNPFQAPDRISFSSPVATLSFARNEWPLSFDINATGAALTGLLCNPNPNAGSALTGDAGVARDLGIFYRSNSAISIGPPGISGVAGPSPYRLRGIFGFATLTTGAMVAIDVDDWDAPCRRPDPMGTLTQADGGAPVLDHVTSSIAPPEPAASSANDLDPYHASVTAETVAANVYSAAVTQEGFFPVSAPHRSRSLQYLRNDPSLGNHLPRIDVLPQLFVNDAIQTAAPDETRVPILLATGKNGLTDPNEAKVAGDANPKREEDPLPAPNLRFSFESPEVHLDQGWTVTYEGLGPNVKGLAGAISTTDGYQSLTITTDQGLFCRRGVEDFRVGQQKAAAIISAAAKQGLLVPDRLDRKIADYVQLNEDILPQDDPYWTLGSQACWAIEGLDVSTPQNRYNACAVTFGSGQDVNPEMSVQRDFPVLEAYQDHLVVGRYGYPSDQNATTSSREVVSKNKDNASFLKLMQCCFHNQVQFNVRTGGEWVAQGAKNGFLHHVTEAAGGQCVLSCNARDALLNARAPLVSQIKADGTGVETTLLASNTTQIGRNLPLAMRNPMFSFYIVNGYVKNAAATGGMSPFTDILPLRDSQWRFTTRGQFQPLFINLASTTTAVSPQSMKFIESLGQVAIVDGEAQGLMLVDLNVLALSHSPYY